MGPDLADGFLETGLVTPQRMRVIDTNAMALGVTELQLMESAGRGLADHVLASGPDHVLILCGKGNNGGDGMVAARHLSRHARTDVAYLDAGKRSGACDHQLAALRHARIPLLPFANRDDLKALEPLFARADIIVDCLLGTGAGGAVREPLKTCVAMANATKARIIAADIPTPGMRSDAIIAFHRAKIAGSTVADIGIPVEAECFTGPGELTLLPPRRKTGHKGVGGHVLIIGGGPYQGAPYLAGLGALRAGADIVRIASPVFEPIPDLIYERLDGKAIGPEHTERLIGLVEKADVVVCGNGLGTESHAVVTAIAPHCKKAVFDADALRLPLPKAKGETIYTPHAGEFARITGVTLPEDTIGKARVAKQAGLPGTVILKGHIDIITDGKQVRFNRTGDPAMTVGGTGDVLAGIAGALLCQLPAFEAACLAAYVNGRAGEAAVACSGGGLLASDLVGRIPQVLYGKRIRNGA
ncbi:NAD(P)H-hydrate dehydratase [Methanoregula sp.]|uniref:NAD(P)H-hydrate dehydratase n=1 Tax=Methanoregula sp. TaxID=2052170 RepID=UPI003C7197AF